MDRLRPTPPHQPLAMPPQSIAWHRGARLAPLRHGKDGLRVVLARILLVVLTVSATVFAVMEMEAAVIVGGVTALEWALVSIFAVAFAWISFSAANALVGVVLRQRSTGPPAQAPEGTGPTALVMPVYNEDPAHTFSALAAMGEDIDPARRDAFEVFILSDTTDPEIWIAEERAFQTLRETLAIPVWYRRRRHNVDRKAGNVADFVRRWGGRYAHMVVLDADSLMSGPCLTALRDHMAADEGAGIIQTAPVLIGAETPFARAQQHANGFVGPVVAGGLAAWQGASGNYWGHNAIIRLDAFAEAAGLPHLDGAPPFGGSILSHDFVEAALIRRAGWSVKMLPDLKGSYEGAPTDVFGVVVRDRRWAQGNLQHARLLGVCGLATVSRVHLGIGIFAYVMSPVWLALILVGVALSVQATFIRPEYFAEGFALFPTWPAFDSERMIALFALSLVVLLVPKGIGLVRALALKRVRRSAGGAPKVFAGALGELVASTLVAPIMMLSQSAIVASILVGRAVGWTPQARNPGRVDPYAAIRFCLPHMALGAGLGAIAFVHSPTLAAWMSPTLVALILSVPIVMAAGSSRLGEMRLVRWLLETPQARVLPQVAARQAALLQRFKAPTECDALLALARDASLRHHHLTSLEGVSRPRGSVDAPTAIAAAKLEDAGNIDELAHWLSRDERAALLAERRLLLAALDLCDGAVQKSA
ncbi:MAG: glucans biosynthesis glucosyltransferase MdoH [Pseudomonadota bacterium]